MALQIKGVAGKTKSNQSSYFGPAYNRLKKSFCVE